MSLPTCPTCVYARGICKKTGVEIRTTTGCTYHTPKPITNADRIRVTKTSEELMEAIFHALKMSNCYTDSRVGMVTWLESELWDYPSIKEVIK